MATHQPPLQQPSTLPPAHPAYVLRGHTAQIHAVHFFRQNLRLLTGDADGWVVLWDVSIKRPVAVWKAHAKTILGVGAWGEEGEKVITHGRDNKLHIWLLRPSDEASLSQTLPLEDISTSRPPPRLLHTLDVNALNFCAFATCLLPPPTSTTTKNPSDLLLAVPGLQDGSITLTILPSETRHSTIAPPPSTNVGMLMALALHSSPPNPTILKVMAGYESGHVALYQSTPSFSSDPSKWNLLSMTQPHTQPLLSLSPAPGLGVFYSSAADAIVARHSLSPDSGNSTTEEARVLQTKHAGQQSLAVRSDGRIFATAGWDGRVRVYATGGGAKGKGKGMVREVAVLKWHREGVYAVAFAQVLGDGDGKEEKMDGEEGGGGEDEAREGDCSVVATRQTLTVAQQRLEKARTTHWLAAGSKDGRVSLWDIY